MQDINLGSILKERIKKTRMEQDFTQVQVAKAIDIAESSYQRLEAGKNPSLDTLYKLAEFFNVSVDYLLGRESEFSESQLTEYLSTLSEEQLYSLEMQVKAIRLQIKEESDSQQVTEEKKTINSDLSMNLKQPE